MKGSAEKKEQPAPQQKSREGRLPFCRSDRVRNI